METNETQTRQIESAFLEKLGRIVTHWALIEAAQIDLLTACLRSDPGMTLMLAQSVSAATVTNWVRKLTQVGDNPEESVTELEALLLEVDALRTERNSLVHGIWATGSSDEGTVVIQTVRLKAVQPIQQRLVTLADLDEIIEDISRLYTNLRAFMRAHEIAHS